MYIDMQSMQQRHIDIEIYMFDYFYDHVMVKLSEALKKKSQFYWIDCNHWNDIKQTENRKSGPKHLRL